MEHSNLILEVIGKQAFEKLCIQYGGLDLHIPQSMDTQSAHYLADIIGKKATEDLVAWGGSSRVYVPKLYDMELQKRREELRERRARGQTYAEIAKNYTYISGYTERQVYLILADPGNITQKPPTDDGQTSFPL